MLPHDLTIAVSGGLILWFGWYGFNPGSTLSAMDFVGIGRVATNTTLAACAAGLTSILYGYFKMKNVGRQLHHERIPGRAGRDYLPLLLGQPHGRGPARRNRRSDRHRGRRRCWNGCELMIPSAQCRFTASAASGERSHSGLFACGQYGATGPIAPDNSAPLRGLFYGGGLQVLKAQIIGSACITLATFGVAMVVMSWSTPWECCGCPRRWKLYGMDLHEHGISAYPEYVISALGARRHGAGTAFGPRQGEHCGELAVTRGELTNRLLPRETGGRRNSASGNLTHKRRLRSRDDKN